MQASQGRIAYIETIRGLACILLVSYHVIGSNSGFGLRLPDEHYFRVINGIFRDSRMPLFSFISGFIFNALVIDWAQWKGKSVSKARRLLLPLVCVGSIHYVFQQITVGASQPYLTIFYLPYEHFWFLQATFLLMIIHLTLSFALKSHVKAAAVLFCGLAAIYVLVGPWQPNIFSSYNALYLAPYFFAGHLLSSAFSGGFEPSERTRWVSGGVLGICLASLLLVSFLQIRGIVIVEGSAQRFLRFLTGIVTCGFLMSIRPRLPLLMKLGAYSFAIYLFHVIFAAGTRVAVTKVMPSADPALLYVLCMAAGLGGPIVLSFAIMRLNLASLLLLGINRKKVPTAIARPSSQTVNAVTPI